MPSGQIPWSLHSIFSFSFNSEYWFFNKWEHSMSFVPPHCFYISEQFTIRWVFMHSLNLMKQKFYASPCSWFKFFITSIHLFISLKNSVLDCLGRRKVSKSLNRKTSPYSATVMPHMKNCVQFINWLKLSRERYLGW